MPALMGSQIKDSRSYHFRAPKMGSDYSLLLATVLAVGLHAVVIFGISFSEAAAPSKVAQDVTTVLTDNLQKNEQADFIANASQQGGGEADEKHLMETASISPLQADTVNPTDDIITQAQTRRQQQYQQSYLRTTLSLQKAPVEDDNKKDQASESFEQQEQRIREQIATLETKIGTSQQLLAKKSAVQTVSSNSTTTGAAAQYIENFRQQAYHVGNQNYPQAARANNITGDVRLLVIIDNTGKVKALRVLESSGSPLLDEAAKESVRKAAPFGKFSDDMQDILELRIIRTWRFGDSLQVEEN